MRVRLFDGSNYRTIEKTINIWLTSNPAIKIHFAAQSQDAGTDDTLGTIAITVWYEEGKND